MCEGSCFISIDFSMQNAGLNIFFFFLKFFRDVQGNVLPFHILV